MPMTHVPEILAENRFQKTGTGTKIEHCPIRYQKPRYQKTAVPERFGTILHVIRYRFLPRDAMQARPMPSCGVCLCVCHVREFCQNE